MVRWRTPTSDAQRMVSRTGKFVAQVDEAFKTKEAEVMEI